MTINDWRPITRADILGVVAPVLSERADNKAINTVGYPVPDNNSLTNNAKRETNIMGSSDYTITITITNDNQGMSRAETAQLLNKAVRGMANNLPERFYVHGTTIAEVVG